ncbi:DUF1707 domain-containing protein [Streptomyces mirabilis]|uniref:DUF1707 SHOCT-like domain-containing protein n=2 Tax=Streptomyces TaxID=1883 RepID=UPI002E2BD511|nr:DUF1707 domain-containing protein [Streptomyces mirabilis]
MNDSEEHITSPALRASDAERDQVEAQLQHHYAVGRLTLPELEERVVAAYEARTREQLHALLRDLPGQVEIPASPIRVIDSRLLIVLLCVSPPAALVYWLISQRSVRRRNPRPQALESAREGGDLSYLPLKKSGSASGLSSGESW